MTAQHSQGEDCQLFKIADPTMHLLAAPGRDCPARVLLPQSVHFAYL